jgi:hypothetical protein
MSKEAEPDLRADFMAEAAGEDAIFSVSWTGPS